MNIAQALKKKNVLTGELKELRSTLLECNTQIKNPNDSTVVWEYNIDDVIKSIVVKAQELINIKAAIQKANQPKATEIYTLSELKSTVASLRVVKQSVKIGIKQAEYRETSAEYVSQENKQAITARIKAFEATIESIQESLDVFNATTQIEI